MQRRARMALIGPMPATPGFLPLRTVAPQVFQNQKKSLAAGWGANQGTKDLPFPIDHLLPFLLIHSCRITFYTALFNSSTLYLRFVALHPPSSNHLSRSHPVGICHQGKRRQTHRQTYIQSRCTFASALVVGTHSLARGQHTQWTVGRRFTPSRRVGTVGLSKNQLRKWFDLRA